MSFTWLAPLLFFSFAQAADTPAQRESYLDLISKAQNLTLQHDRLQATQILARALKGEKPGTPAQKQLRKSLSNLAEIFYTEKAQKAFELGQSMQDPRSAADKFGEALAAEPGNTKILKAIGRARIRAGECAEGLRVSESALEMDPFAPELLLLRIQSLQCLDEKESAHAALVAQTELLRTLKPAYDMALVRDLMMQKRWAEARRKAKEIQNSDAAFPEALLALFRIGQELKSLEIEPGEQYVELCQKGAERLRKKYENEPSVCLLLKDVENDVKLLRRQEEEKF